MSPALTSVQQSRAAAYATAVTALRGWVGRRLVANSTRGYGAKTRQRGVWGHTGVCVESSSVGGAPAAQQRMCWDQGISRCAHRSFHQTVGLRQSPPPPPMSPYSRNDDAQRDFTNQAFSTSGAPFQKLAVVGGGKMAEALVGGLIRRKAKRDSIVVTDPNASRRKFFEEQMEIKTLRSNAEAVADADVILVCVKPQILKPILGEIRQHMSSSLPKATPSADSVEPADASASEKTKSSPLIISIAAGGKLSMLLNVLGPEAAVVRTMPNTPAMVSKGVTMWISSSNVTERQSAQVRSIFQSVGNEMEVDDESYLDMATAISGSGPAYSFLVAEAMVDTGVHMGLPRSIAQELVEDTLLGAAHYAKRSKLHPAILRNDITSPGGTTAAAMFEAEKNGLRSAMSNTIWAAYHRSIELGNDDETS